MKYQIILVLFLFIFLFGSTTLAKVIINEFVIDDSPQQIELLNIASESADISNWYLDDSGGSSFFTIPLTQLPAYACVVFQADFNLNKSTADQVRLFDGSAPPTSASAMLIDSFSYKASSGSAISFLRIPDGSDTWATGSASFGQLNSTKQSCLVTLPVEIAPTPQPVPTITPSPIPIYQDIQNIFISEVMVYPDSGNNEWVELYNDNNFNVDLVDWYIDDTENAGSSPKKFSLHIEAKNYAVFELSSSVFNNDTDTIRVLDYKKNEKDSLEYFSPKKAMTLGRISFETDVFCNQEPSKNIQNNSCILDSQTLLKTAQKSILITITPLTKQPKIISTIQNESVFRPTGTVLGASLQTDAIVKLYSKNNEPRYLAYVQGLSMSAIIISFMNIALIIGKIMKRLAIKTV